MRLNHREAFTDYYSKAITFSEMSFQIRHEQRELLRERLAVVLLFLRPHIPPRRQHEAVLGEFLDRRCLTEAGHRTEGPLAVLGRLPPLGRRLAAPLAEG